jgi:hypothetical protein
MKALFDGREIDIKISKEAEIDLAILKDKVCKDCPFRKECAEKDEGCLIRL